MSREELELRLARAKADYQLQALPPDVAAELEPLVRRGVDVTTARVLVENERLRRQVDEERRAREQWERQHIVSTATRPVGPGENRVRTLTYSQYAERMARASRDEKRQLMQDEELGRLKLRPD